METKSIVEVDWNRRGTILGLFPRRIVLGKLEILIEKELIAPWVGDMPLVFLYLSVYTTSCDKAARDLQDTLLFSAQDESFRFSLL